LWAWGYNGTGESGLGNRTNYSSPKQIGALTTWLSVGAGNYHSLATASSGLYAWGYNILGQLGLGNLTSYSSPKQVGSLTTWLKAVGGQYYTIALG